MAAGNGQSRLNGSLISPGAEWAADEAHKLQARPARFPVEDAPSVGVCT